MRILRLLAFIGFALLFAGCATDARTGNGGIVVANESSFNTTLTPSPAAPESAVEKVEIIHFHGTHQCYSCKTVGQYAEETVNTYFAEELKSGKITFAHINAELPENQELASKYEVTGASLWIGVYDEKGFHKEQNTQVWYKIDNKTEYMSYLKDIIQQRLDGASN